MKKTAMRIIPILAIMLSVSYFGCGVAEDEEEQYTEEIKYTLDGTESVFSTTGPTKSFYRRKDGTGALHRSLLIKNSNGDISQIDIMESQMSAGSVITQSTNGSFELFSCPEVSTKYFGTNDWTSFSMLIIECTDNGKISGKFSGSYIDSDDETHSISGSFIGYDNPDFL